MVKIEPPQEGMTHLDVYALTEGVVIRTVGSDGEEVDSVYVEDEELDELVAAIETATNEVRD